MFVRIRTSVSASLLFGLAVVAPAQAPIRTTAQSAARNTVVAATPGEQRAVRAFNAARQSPLELHAFLMRMPKGGDLHMHLSGAIYAETFIKDAAADLLCVDPKTMSFFKPSATTRSLPPQPVCGEGNVRAESAFKDQKLYDALIDSFSMRSFVPSAGISGHDQFFATFARFNGIDKSHTAEWLDEVAARAAAQNEQYLEVMETPVFADVTNISSRIGWPTTPADPAQNRTGDATGTTREDLVDSATPFLPQASATKSPSTARSSTTLSTPGTKSKTVANPAPEPPAPSKFDSSIRFFARLRRNRSSPRPCSPSKSPP